MNTSSADRKEKHGDKRPTNETEFKRGGAVHT